MKVLFPVSYCIGVYNEAIIVRRKLASVDKYLQNKLGKDNFEIVVVDNASTDDTGKIVRGIKNRRIKYFYTKTKGYGAAFKIAFRKSKFEHFVYTAIDLPFGFTDFENTYDKWHLHDIIFASKTHPLSKASRGFFRTLSSYCYQFLLSVLFQNKISDTQGSVFFKKSAVSQIIRKVTSDNAFFSTELALYAQKQQLVVSEVPVVLKKDPKKRVSKYKLLSDGGRMLYQIVKEVFLYYGGKKTFLKVISLILVTTVLCFASFGFSKGLNLYFWRDDWTAFWFLKNDPAFFFNRWIFPSRHPGEFLATFPWFYFVTLNHVWWQLLGVVLKVFASISTGIVSHTIFKNVKTGVLSCLFFASYFGGLEGFTWISARLSGYLIVFYGVSLFLFLRVINSNRFYFISFISFFVLMILEPGRSIFFIVLLGLYALAIKKLTKKLLLVNIYAVFLGLISTPFGRTMLGFKSSELVSPYSGEIFAKLNILSTFKSFLISLSGLLTGPMIIMLIVLLLSYLFYLFSQKNNRKLTGEVIGVSFFLLWIVLFFGASFISDPGVFVPGDSRYFTISGVGVSALFGYFISKLPQKSILFIFTLLLLVNIQKSRLVIANSYETRGVSLVLPLLKAQETSVPLGFTNGIFIVTGSEALRGYVFDWSYGGGLPFALTRNISHPLGVPVASSEEEVVDMICHKIPVKYYLDNYIKLTPHKLVVDNIYAWEVLNNSTLVDQTEKVRKSILNRLSCLR